MSHVTTVDLKITDLNALAEACEELGLELVRGQTSYKWFGRYMGDYVDPELERLGIAVDGTCDHVVRVKGANDSTYEIGLKEHPERKGEFMPLFDFWAGGHGLMEKISTAGPRGEDCNRLKNAYSASVVRRQLKRQGIRFKETRNEDGSRQFTASVR